MKTSGTGPRGRKTCTGLAPYFDAIIFDCDGVLVDSELLSMTVSQRIVADLGWDVDLATMMRTFVGSSHEFFVEQLELNLGRSMEADWENPYRGWLEEALRTELKEVPGITQALDHITLPTAVASNSEHRRIRTSLQIVGLLERFDGRISSAEDVHAGKPAPDVYLHAADLLDVQAQRCIAIDDSRFGVQAARRAGMYVLAYGEHWCLNDLPGDDRLFVLRDLDDLPRVVDRLVESGSPRASTKSAGGGADLGRWSGVRG